MNENLLRDLHDEEMAALKAVKEAIIKLEQKQTVTPEEIVGINTMIANIKSSALDDDEVKALFDNLSKIIKAFQATLESHGKNLKEVSNLCTSISNLRGNDSHEIAQGVEALKVASEKIDIKVANFKIGHYATLTWAIAMTLICGCVLYQAEALKSQVSHLQENSIKYRYIKMKGEASPKRIAELEDIFDYNRNPTKIREIYKDVATFEEAVRKKAIADEQARLQLLESERLSREANKLKEK
ncbi:MAG: hypothetical protein SNI70_11750 [Rikenellaceae bacterium]